MALDVNKIRDEFPILTTKVHNKPLVYLDSAATTLKPKAVIDRMSHHYLFETSNVHRGIHYLSDQATTQFESARKTVQKFINAHDDETVFTHGTTESVNIVARGFAEAILKPGDEILISEMEHHSNLVPWQMAAKKSGAKVRYIPVNVEGELELNKLSKLLNQKTKIVAVTAVSNSLGTINPIRQITESAHALGIPVFVDAAQAVANMMVDVQQWDCDFLAFSAHKLFGPTGIGVLYGKKDWLNRLPPLFGGGAMIETVTFENTTYLEAPFRFEAGTPHITGAIGLGAAIDFVTNIGFSNIEKHEYEILSYATEVLSSIKKLKIIGTSNKKGPIVSFVIEGTHHQDIGSLVDNEGVAIRTGHHCTQALLAKFGLTGTARASFSIYSTKQDVEALHNALTKAIHLLG